MSNNNFLKKDNCIFCNMDSYIVENELAYAIYDKFPATKGHMLIIPKRHIESFFDTTIEEKIAMFDLIDQSKNLLDEKYRPDGYNVGVNINEAGGQTVFHVHMHLMPRFKGDVIDPTGGVRGAIPQNMKNAMK